MAAINVDALLESGDEESLYENEDYANAMYARSIVACVEASSAIMNTMLKGLTDANSRVRSHASMGAVTLAKTETLRAFASQLAEVRLPALARAAMSIDERCAHILALGDLGESPLEFLGDPSPAVRMCAALAPSLATNPVAIRILLETLEHHVDQIDTWFTDRPPQFSMRPRFAVVNRLVQHVKDFDVLVDAAVSVITATSKQCVDYDWGPLLAAAFPQGDGKVSKESQHRFLSALVKNRECWDPRFGNPDRWFQMAGLLYNRADCEQRLNRQ